MPRKKDRTPKHHSKDTQVSPEDMWIAIERGETLSTYSGPGAPEIWESSNAYSAAITRWASEREAQGRPLPTGTTGADRVDRAPKVKPEKVKRQKMTPEQARERHRESSRQYYNRCKQGIKPRQRTKRAEQDKQSAKRQWYIDHREEVIARGKERYDQIRSDPVKWEEYKQRCREANNKSYRLAVDCTSCDRKIKPTQRFCPGCGSPRPGSE